MKWSMGLAALILSLSVLISRFMGLIRDKVISWQFGVGNEADIYFTAFVIPDFINYLLAGGYLSITLIPFLAEKFQKDVENNTEGTKDAWKFFSTVFSWAGISIISCTSLAFIFADGLVEYIAPGFSAEQYVRLVYFLRIILFAQVFFLLGACFSAILYIRKQFAVPALMPLIYNALILFCGVSFPYFGIANGMEGFCYGVLIGAFLGAFLLPWYAVWRNGLEWKLSFRHKDLKKFLLLALPLMLGQSIVVLDEQFIRIFGSMAGEGAVSLLNYARRVMLVPVGVVAQAAAVASFPYLATLIAKKAYLEFDNTLIRALKSSLVLIIPITAFMILQSNSILGLIFEGGYFSSTHTEKASPLLQIMLIAVPFWTIQQIVARAFYAKKDTITPAIIGTIATICVVPFYIILVPLYGSIFVAIMATLSVILYTFILLYVWQRKNPSQLIRECLMTFLRSCLIVLVPIFFAWYTSIKLEFLLASYSPLLQQCIEITVSGMVFSFLWLLLAWNLDKANFLLIAEPIVSKIKTKINRKG